MSEKAIEQTITELAVQFALEKLNKMQANEQVTHLEAVLKEREERIKELEKQLGVTQDVVQD